MNITRVTVPKEHHYHSNQCDLEQDDIDVNIPKCVTDIWYWYTCSGYDGNGMMILKTIDGYYLHDLGHCSCYTPCDYMSLTMCYPTLEDLKNNCSEELQELLPSIT